MLKSKIREKINTVVNYITLFFKIRREMGTGKVSQCPGKRWTLETDCVMLGHGKGSFPPLGPLFTHQDNGTNIESTFPGTL